MKGRLPGVWEGAGACVSRAQQTGRNAAQLRVYVIATAEKGTIAALRSAAGLAVDLNAQIHLMGLEAVPSRFLLEEPLGSVAPLQRMLCGLVGHAGIVDKEVRVGLYLCRDRRQTLRRVLPPIHWW
jgi:hypothetical protein